MMKRMNKEKIRRTHGAPYHGYVYVSLRFGGGGGDGTSLGEWEHNNNNMKRMLDVFLNSVSNSTF